MIMRKTLALGNFGVEVINAFDTNALYAMLQELLNNPFVFNEDAYKNILMQLGFTEFDVIIWICEAAPEIERLRNDIRTLHANYVIRSWVHTDSIVIVEVEQRGNA